ncbi:MAG: RNA-binding S4 domain-containing protein [Novosphingobium sp.]
MTSLRLDKLLWFLRLMKTRSLAQRVIGEGHIRRNGTRVGRAHEPVAVGDVLTVPIGSRVRVIEVLALPVRRGPASEAQACYRALDDGGLDDRGGLAVGAAPSSAGFGEPQP